MFDPSYAASHLTAEKVDALATVQPLVGMVADLQQERCDYKEAVSKVTIDHTENSEDHSFTEQVLKFFKEHGEDFPHWSEAARIVFSFTPNSAAAERVFSLLNSMFGDQQDNALMDYVQTAVMLKYNKRLVG